MLRDFHSPNLIWLPERRELARLGLLDFQDAMMGPAAYDLASLLQDARVDVPEATEVALLGRYVRRRRSVHIDFDGSQFIKVYVTLDKQADWMRAGMAGEARVDVEKRRLVWIWTHRLIDFLKLKLWM